MKSSFNFLQIANWIYLMRCKLKDFRISLDKQIYTKQQAISILKTQKRHLELIKDILNRKANLQGIQPDFLKNLKNIKKEYNIQD